FSSSHPATPQLYTLSLHDALPIFPPRPPTGDDLAQVPPDLDQTFSKVREAQAKLMQRMAELGVTISFNKSPKEMIAEFYTRYAQDRKSTRLNSSHLVISYAVFCLK